MIEVIHGRYVWDKIYDRLPIGNLREAAIAYVGRDGDEYLNMFGPTDVLIFDGSDESIASNHIDLDEIEKLMKSRVSLYSRPGLHAKMMLVEDDSETLAVVGSANVSANSVENLVEAVAVFDEPEAVDQVRMALFEYRAGAKPLDQQWLKRARQIKRHPRSASSRWQPPPQILADSTKPAWLVYYEWGGTMPPITVWVAKAEIEADTGATAELSPPMLKTQFDRIEVGDSVTYVLWPAGNRAVRANTPIDEPGIIMRKVVTSGNGRWLISARRSRGPSKAWRDVEAALSGAGWRVSPSKALTGKERAALFRLFADSAAS